MTVLYGVAFDELLSTFIGEYSRVLVEIGGARIAGDGLQLRTRLLVFWTPQFGLFTATSFLVALGQTLRGLQANSFVSRLKFANC